MATSPTSPWPGRRLAPYVSTTPTHNLDLSLDSLSTPAFPSSGPSNLHPPDYDSIQTPSTSAIQASQASRNLEKQALRDAWREQALAQHHRGSAPRSVAAPPSIEPSSDSNSSGEHRVGLGISQGRRSPPRSDTSDTQKRSGSTGILPEGMEVHEALAKCEDPTLGWSLRFWVTIADPVVSSWTPCPVGCI